MVAGQTIEVSSQDIFICKVCEEVVRGALKPAGITTKFYRFPSLRALNTSNAGEKTVAEVCRIKGAEKKWKNLKMVSPPVTYFYAGVFVNKKYNKKPILKWTDLEGSIPDRPPFFEIFF